MRWAGIGIDLIDRCIRIECADLHTLAMAWVSQKLTMARHQRCRIRTPGGASPTMASTHAGTRYSGATERIPPPSVSDDGRIWSGRTGC
jgi:hypothetical protein